MTVGELIAELSRYPGEREVVARHYGVETVVREIFLVHDPTGRVDIVLDKPVTSKRRERSA